MTLNHLLDLVYDITEHNTTNMRRLCYGRTMTSKWRQFVTWTKRWINVGFWVRYCRPEYDVYVTSYTWQVDNNRTSFCDVNVTLDTCWNSIMTIADKITTRTQRRYDVWKKQQLDIDFWRQYNIWLLLDLGYDIVSQNTTATWSHRYDSNLTSICHVNTALDQCYSEEMSYINIAWRGIWLLFILCTASFVCLKFGYRRE